MRVRSITSAVTCAVIALLCAAAAGYAQESPPNPEAASEIAAGNQALVKQDFRGAVKAFKDANKLEHNRCATCFVGLAVASFRAGDANSAVKDCDQALKCADDDHQRGAAHFVKAQALEVEAAGEAKKLSQAVAEYQCAVKLDARTPLYHFALGAALLKQSQDQQGVAELNQYVELDPSGPHVTEARQLIARPERARFNFAPDFEFTSLQGEHVSLDGLAGDIVVLDFWATWCPPCRESVPELKELVKKYGNKHLVLISISADDDENAWRQFTAKKQMDWAQYRDADGNIRRLFNVHEFPTYLLIDGKGIIQDRLVGLNPQETVVSRLKAKLKSMPELE